MMGNVSRLHFWEEEESSVEERRRVQDDVGEV